MKTLHTVGPWNLGDSDKPVTQFAVFGANQKPVCRIASHPSIDEGIRNGALIAAAPELLAALEWALKQMPEPVLPGDYTNDYWSARAAITKAKG